MFGCYYLSEVIVYAKEGINTNSARVICTAGVFWVTAGAEELRLLRFRASAPKQILSASVASARSNITALPQNILDSL